MKSPPRLSLLLLPLALVCACAPLTPGLPGPEAPAGPLVQAIEARQRAFTGLTGLAGVQAARKGRKRSFENVGIAIQPPGKLRMEAYGPLGGPLATLVWNGRTGELRLQGSRRLLTRGNSGLEKLLGVDVDPGELGAALAGTIPELGDASHSAAYCGQRAGCVLEIRQNSLLRRVAFAPEATAVAAGPRITASELYRSGTLVYRARFEEMEDRSGYLFPMKIVIENPERNVAVTVRYHEVDVNIPVPDEVFTLDTGEDDAP